MNCSRCNGNGRIGIFRRTCPLCEGSGRANTIAYEDTRDDSMSPSVLMDPLDPISPIDHPEIYTPRDTGHQSHTPDAGSAHTHSSHSHDSTPSYDHESPSHSHDSGSSSYDSGGSSYDGGSFDSGSSGGGGASSDF